MKTKGRLESEIQGEVIFYLKTRNDIFWFRSNTGGAVYDDFYVQFGIKGASDIQGLQAPHGRFFGLECKREIGGTVSEDQKRWGGNVIRHGGIWAVIRGADEAAAALGPQLANVEKFRKKRNYVR